MDRKECYRLTHPLSEISGCATGVMRMIVYRSPRHWCDDDDVDSVVELICAQRNRLAPHVPRLISRKTSQTMMELAKIFREKVATR